jgi:magnesium chelatase family protein
MNMFSRVLSGGLIGVDSYRLEVEVDCCGGIGQIQIVGLPDTAVKESQERVRSAIKACGYFMPPAKKWVVNLAPADTKKEGPSYDLPIAVGILASCGLIPIDNLSRLWMVGELGLDGGVRPVVGVLPLAIACLQSGAEGIIVPEANAEEAALVEGLKVFPVSHLHQAVLIAEELRNGAVFDGCLKEVFNREVSNAIPSLNFSDVKGQDGARRALEIAAAGRHNVLLVGPPGAGKSMLAERMPSIMPPLEFDEAIELTKLYSVAGLLNSECGLVKQRPFRSPHHSSSVAGLVGGGKAPKPGEISLSHHGILFLDELTEFSRSHLDNLRQPLETRKVTISRALHSLTYPASFIFVGACNPCPCGYRGDQVKCCVCTPGQADRYWARLSGPLLDRIDIHISVKKLDEHDLARVNPSESSEEMRRRVLRAVYRQTARNAVVNSKKGPADGVQFIYNGQLPSRMVSKICRVSEVDRHFLARTVSQLGMSARAFDRILRVARTIADVADREEVLRTDIAEALRYRLLEPAS